MLTLTRVAAGSGRARRSVARVAVLLALTVVPALAAMLPHPALAQALDAFGRPTSPAPSHDRGQAAGDASGDASHFVLPAPVRRVIGASVRIQGEWNAEMEDALGDLHEHGTPHLWWTLVLLSFGYGVLHALGPGHGKVAVGAYLGSRNARIAHAVGLSCWTAFVQAMSAIVLVGATVLLVPAGVGGMLGHAAHLTIVSYAALLVAGLWATWSVLTHRGCCGARPALELVPRRRARGAAGEGDEAGSEAASEGRYLGARVALARTRGTPRICDDARQSEWRIGQALMTGFASGLRPCVGAIFMLVAALAQGVFGIGVISTFAMAAGVALTVSVVGIGSLGANRLAFALALSERRGFARVRRGAALAGALFISAFAACQIAALCAGWSSGALS
jgi:nickel/cobalt exporter